MNGTTWGSIRTTLLIIAALSAVSVAQVPTATGTVQVQAVKNETMSISATAFGSAFDVSSGNSGQQNTTITTNWSLKPSRTSVTVCAYMDPAQGALTPADTAANPDTIPLSAVQAKVGAGSFASINASPACGIATGVTTVHTYSLATHADRTGVTGKTDTVAIQVAGVPATIEPDTYTGTITVVAFTAP